MLMELWAGGMSCESLCPDGLLTSSPTAHDGELCIHLMDLWLLQVVLLKPACVTHSLRTNAARVHTLVPG